MIIRKGTYVKYDNWLSGIICDIYVIDSLHGEYFDIIPIHSHLPNTVVNRDDIEFIEELSDEDKLSIVKLKLNGYYNREPGRR